MDDEAIERLPSMNGMNLLNALQSPSAAMLVAARIEAGLDLEAAAQLIYRSPEEWDRWERSRGQMDPGLWQLWQIRLLRRRDAAAAALPALPQGRP